MINPVFICHPTKTSFKDLFNEIQNNESYCLRRFIIIDARVTEPSSLFSKCLNTLGCQQPKSLLIPNLAITYNVKNHIAELCEKYFDNQNEGIAILVTEETEACSAFLKEKGVPESSIKYFEQSEKTALV